MEKMPTVRLTNGLVVGNFSSPHEFQFEDGSILPACSKERAEALSVEFKETVHDSGDIRYQNISLGFDLRDDVLAAFTNDCEGEVDIVLCALPMIKALQEKGLSIIKGRTIRCLSRTDKRIHIDKFGV